MKNKHSIEDFFKENLNDAQEDLSSQEMNELEFKLRKMNFYKFSLTNFNVYFAGLILSSFLLCCYTTGHYLYHFGSYELKNSVVKTDFNEEKELVKSNSNLLAETSFAKNETSQLGIGNQNLSSKNSIFKNERNKTTTYSPNLISSKDSALSSFFKTFDTDSVAIMPKTELKEDVFTKKRLDTVFIHKQDTIFKFDTLKVKRKKHH
jgi:hypothetical protein